MMFIYNQKLSVLSKRHSVYDHDTDIYGEADASLDDASFDLYTSIHVVQAYAAAQCIPPCPPSNKMSSPSSFDTSKAQSCLIPSQWAQLTPTA